MSSSRENLKNEVETTINASDALSRHIDLLATDVRFIHKDDVTKIEEIDKILRPDLMALEVLARKIRDAMLNQNLNIFSAQNSNVPGVPLTAFINTLCIAVSKLNILLKFEENETEKNRKNSQKIKIAIIEKDFPYYSAKLKEYTEKFKLFFKMETTEYSLCERFSVNLSKLKDAVLALKANFRKEGEEKSSAESSISSEYKAIIQLQEAFTQSEHNDFIMMYVLTERDIKAFKNNNAKDNQKIFNVEESSYSRDAICKINFNVISVIISLLADEPFDFIHTNMCLDSLPKSINVLSESLRLFLENDSNSDRKITYEKMLAYLAKLTDCLAGTELLQEVVSSSMSTTFKR